MRASLICMVLAVCLIVTACAGGNTNSINKTVSVDEVKSAPIADTSAPEIAEISAEQGLAGLENIVGDGKLDANPKRTIKRSSKVIQLNKTTISGKNLSEDFAFRRELLSDSEKKSYDQIYDAIAKRKESITLMSIVTTDRIEDVMESVYYDSPELFWFNNHFGWTLNEKNQVLDVSLEYNDLSKDLPKYKNEIASAISGVLAEARKLPSEYDKVLYVNDYLVNTITYELNAPNSQNMYSALVSKRTVCAGYSKAFHYLLQELGIRANTMTGDVPAGRHAWNIVAIDGKYYNVDVTWNDYGRDSTPGLAPKRTYLNLTDKEISVSHTRESATKNLPACTATDANFFVKNGLVVSSPDEFASRVIKNGKDNGGNVDISLKFTEKSAFDQSVAFFRKEAGNKWWKQIMVPMAESLSLDPYNYKFKYVPVDDNLVMQVAFTTPDAKAVGANKKSAQEKPVVQLQPTQITNEEDEEYTLTDFFDDYGDEYTEVKTFNEYIAISAEYLVDGEGEADFILFMNSKTFAEAINDLESDDMEVIAEIIISAAEESNFDPEDISVSYDYFEDDNGVYMWFQYFAE